ncbi:TIGR03751 family conjugal transfer lipoprotein [Ectothiorhodospira variabilis]|uniref:TIGR03751 family conjugal transfer lipoprotein n=1 Tax=Ectothiorhodospira variabilis TaxID=505694 RepID=UPI001EFAE397|nr:TIGR03751 family conjugal transfer lipoprotein [Ectothiorhodospira variabilis]MCG5495566.1 TIGR03751 family conjugal transfer lipoprotein [Ectothiorhodospira variabilis]MCG5505174.1 TIGR03751 family conjugal transfer lipoprotein [Ectothiorhodospira variabilis]MCG5508331.1 TIGR03751 family conjugal transfer lipoprotein [Ectothiorhodospira variabilis]
MKHASIALCVSISLLTGCATSTKDSILPQDGPTMMEVYEQHMNASGVHEADQAREDLGQRTPRTLGHGDRDLAGYTRDAANEIEQRFTRLPNPTLVMYVFPHLAGPDAAPVPGYSTAFPMYRQTHYALPGEAP